MDFRRNRGMQATALMTAFVASLSTVAEAYSLRPSFVTKYQRRSCLMIYAPPGSGYATPEDEPNMLPASYEPMMEFPGTMRPGRTPENQPFHDLPIGDDDPEPIPWPHFQQIEWHHRWPIPHPEPISIEDFIELKGRWATPEEEAEMRAGARREVQDRKEQAQNERKSTLIVDDDEEDIPDDGFASLGDGLFGQLGSAVDAAADAEALGKKRNLKIIEDSTEDDYEEFLLDLGLDAADGETPMPAKVAGNAKPKVKAQPLKPTVSEVDDDDDIDLDLDLGLSDGLPSIGVAKATSSTDMALSADDDESQDFAIAAIDEDFGLDLGLEDEEDDLADGDEVAIVPLEDFGDDQIEDDESFDDGGFDYDEGDSNDYDGGGDGW